ncbi:uncharacterized protein LOC126904801 [Daktulosphaira vitifoliae]|uniref:uncharacterized protein LOC126904801 n=1 Tax=Daktulosphaira vitifoliae TaxID=58002 RepID=UPI0021A9CE3B|nr:uncharacterized protein LOC126904801 [Daktulosphaira vitifoliae]XP_050540016.1 uncharacterized protein LOC126904801 [Daktulosphaira vitifoliae]
MEGKFNSGLMSIINNLKGSCEMIKLSDDNQLLYNQILSLIKLLPNNGEYFDYFSELCQTKEDIFTEVSYYEEKMGISINLLPNNMLLDSAIKILMQTGIYDYYSNSLFLKYMMIVGNCSRQKLYMDNLDEHIKKLKIAIDQQNDLKCELSSINYTPIGFTAESINIKPINGPQNVENCEKIINLTKKIFELEHKQVEVSKVLSEIKNGQKKKYRGLPPNIEQAMVAIQLAEKNMKIVSKKLIEKLENS